MVAAQPAASAQLIAVARESAKVPSLFWISAASGIMASEFAPKQRKRKARAADVRKMDAMLRAYEGGGKNLCGAGLRGKRKARVNAV
ncbi:hypothetical protein GCM10008941_27840 [Rhizomicrobium palustre]